MARARSRITKTKPDDDPKSLFKTIANPYATAFLARTAEQVLYGGIPVDVAADIFHIQDVDLKALIEKSGLQPIGTHGRGQLYSIYGLAQLVVPPKWTEEEWENILTRRHFPAQLVKEFWGAKKARQDYLLSAGDLWETAEVTATLSEAFKIVAMGIRLITDNVERETTLTVKQRDLINQYVDDALASAAKHLNDVFEDRIHIERIERYEKLTSEKIHDRTNKNKKTATARQNKRKPNAGAKNSDGKGVLAEL